MGGRVLVVALLACIAAVQVATAGASTSGRCWQRLVRDWSDGRIDGTYSVACYRVALHELPEDLRVYSSAPDDIQAALQRTVSHTSERRSRGLAAADRPRARPSIEAAGGSRLDRPAVLAAGLGALGVALVVAGVLARRRRTG
jgi:hypothetical protein